MVWLCLLLHLFRDLVQADRKARDGRLHAAEHLRDEDLSGRNGRDCLDAVFVHILAFHQTAFRLHLVEFLDVFDNDLGGCDRVGVRKRDGGGSVERFVKLGVSEIVERAFHQAVLQHLIIHAGVTELLPESGVFRDVESHVIDDDEGLRGGDLRLDVLNDWPDVSDSEQDIEYLYFRINSQEDINRVRTAYNGWFWAGEKIRFCKPDVLCLVDNGTTHWYWLSNLVKQAKDFVEQFGEVSFD